MQVERTQMPTTLMADGVSAEHNAAIGRSAEASVE